MAVYKYDAGSTLPTNSNQYHGMQKLFQIKFFPVLI